jgi:oxysterol-binding protein-related protein 9/10/11
MVTSSETDGSLLVSHHPPASAYYFGSEALQMSISGHCGQKMTFKGSSIRVEQYGHCTVRLPIFQEEYQIVPPELHIRGLLSGKIFVEITGNVCIKSNQAYEAHLKFLTKPWFTGDYNQFGGMIYHVEDSVNSPVYTIDGDWQKDSYYRIAEGDEKHLLFSLRKSNPPKKIVVPIEEQNEMESRRVWNEVTQALERGDWNTASIEKNAIEDKQRLLYREHIEKRIVWAPKYFHTVVDESDATKTHWEYNHDIAVNMKPISKH